jgi:hypothetical protein
MLRSVRHVVQCLVLCAACVGLVPPVAHSQFLKEQLVGTWALVSWTQVVGDVEEPGLLGRDPIGQFMFAPDGHMCFSAMRRTRSKFGGPGPQAGTPEEKAAAYDGYIGYCGRYNVSDEERSVTFQLELSSYPNWTGSTQKRFVEVTGTRLRVNTPPIPVRGRQMVTTVIWERQK